MTDTTDTTNTKTTAATAPKKPRWRFHWNHLFSEIVTTNICTGCSGCIVACPHDVLQYDDKWHPVLMGKAHVEGDDSHCVHGEKACTMCTRACPRFRDWEPEIDTHLFGRPRERTTDTELIGIYQSILLVEATNETIARLGQDGGLASAMLIFCLEKKYIDAALVNYYDKEWKATPGVAWNKEDVLRAAGSRYTYSANTLAYQEAIDTGAEKLALVGMSCQSSVPPAMMRRGARKPGKKFVLNIGLLCSKTFTDDIYENLIEAEYGVKRTEIRKVNIKGKLQLWLEKDVKDGDYLEIPLKECHPFTREGCKTCPDFSAEHADISMGGIGKYNGRTLTIVRTDTAAGILKEMQEEGWIRVWDAVDEDPGAVALMRKLAKKSRKRWPIAADNPHGPEAAAPGVTPQPPPAPAPTNPPS